MQYVFSLLCQSCKSFRQDKIQIWILDPTERDHSGSLLSALGSGAIETLLLLFWCYWRPNNTQTSGIRWLRVKASRVLLITWSGNVGSGLATWRFQIAPRPLFKPFLRTCSCWFAVQYLVESRRTSPENHASEPEETPTLPKNHQNANCLKNISDLFCSQIWSRLEKTLFGCNEVFHSFTPLSLLSKSPKLCNIA